MRKLKAGVRRDIIDAYIKYVADRHEERDFFHLITYTVFHDDCLWWNRWLKVN